MTPVYKLSANSVKNGRTVYGSMLAGNAAFVPTSFESIATVSLSSSASSIQFTSIPATFSHLQIRGIFRSNRSSTLDTLQIRLNSDTNNNYARHFIFGDSADISAGTSTSQSFANVGIGTGASAASNIFGSNVIDILDYTNTNKYKTIRCLAGEDENNSGNIQFASGLWLNTNAITTITLICEGGSSNFQQYTRFALYGTKGA